MAPPLAHTGKSLAGVRSRGLNCLVRVEALEQWTRAMWLHRSRLAWRLGAALPLQRQSRTQN